MENSNSKQKDTKCEQCVNAGRGRPEYRKASRYSMCQDINLSSVPSVGQRTGSTVLPRIGWIHHQYPQALRCLEGTTLSNRWQRPRIRTLPLNLCLEGSTPEDRCGASTRRRISLWLQGAFLYCQRQLFLLCGFPSAKGRPDGRGGSVRKTCLHG